MYRSSLAVAAPILSALCLTPTALATSEADGSVGGGIGGPSSVGALTQADSKPKTNPRLFRRLIDELQPYYDFKARLQEEHGLSFGADYNAIYQHASESMGEDRAASGIVRLFGSWKLTGDESGNSGSLVAKIENRHAFGTDITPQELASEIGYAGLTAIVFSDAGTLLTNLYWSQSIDSGRVSFVAGIVDVTDYLDIYGLVNPWTNFANLSFSTDPTIPVPNQGLGGAVRVNLSDNFYILGGLADTNGDPGDPLESIDTFFQNNEYLKHIEFGWVSSQTAAFTDNIHLLAWQADKRTDAQVPSGWGATLSYSQKLTERWMPYARAGYSDGGGGVFLERSVSAGLGYSLSHRDDIIGLGAAWGRPSEETFGEKLDDQYTVEAFYRRQIFQHMTINADVQLLIDPALNPDESSIWVFGIGTRLNF